MKIQYAKRLKETGLTSDKLDDATKLNIAKMKKVIGELNDLYDEEETLEDDIEKNKQDDDVTSTLRESLNDTRKNITKKEGLAEHIDAELVKQINELAAKNEERVKARQIRNFKFFGVI